MSKVYIPIEDTFTDIVGGEWIGPTKEPLNLAEVLILTIRKSPVKIKIVLLPGRSAWRILSTAKEKCGNY